MCTHRQEPIPFCSLGHACSLYNLRGDKPRYFGDPALPVEFDPYLYRLEQKERASWIMRIREHGTTGVAAALSDLIR